MSLELALLQRLLKSPFTPQLFWDEHPVIGLAANAHVIRDRGLLPARGEAVDATIHCSPEALAALAAGRAPTGPISYVLGDRPGADRRKQARVILTLAALGWCGPWPAADVTGEHVALVREAWYNLGIGPADGSAALFPTGGPLPDVAVRLTDGAAGTELVTVGLSDMVGQPELTTLAKPRTDPRAAFPALRAAALYVAEHAAESGAHAGARRNSAPPRRLPVGDRVLACAPHPRFPKGLALPNQLTWLVRVGWVE